MELARTIAECHRLRGAATGDIGLVPTMGALHKGHLSLVAAARAGCDTVVASIFVNPTQFGPNEDLHRYPRDEGGDLALLAAADVHIVFLPPVSEIYPDGYATTVTVRGVTEVLEGARRPGHFDGVATVVSKLFNIVQPHRAYFGQKDAQQLAVIRRMTRDLDMPVEIVGCPTVREADGLAISSRNVFLDAGGREQAVSLPRGLRRAAAAFAGGMRDAASLRRLIRDEIEAQPLAEIDYVSVADGETLVELDATVEATALCSVAVRFGGTRLIDNVVLTP